MQWDCIIIGAGSAGCAAAAPLVRAGRRVLVLEAGGSDFSYHIKIPAAVWRIQPGHDWGYECEPDPTRGTPREALHRGRVLGGTSSINGMLYVRGASGDFDRWAQYCGGAGGWSAREVTPIFDEIESRALRIRKVQRPHRVTQAFVESAQALGHRWNDDYNAPGEQAGVSYLQFTQHRGQRWSSADAFLKPLWHRKNLEVLLHATVERLEMEGDRVAAVVYRHRNQSHRATASDVVLCAGAVSSPKILLLSGIGDPEELGRHQIPLVCELPGVGQNLRDHPLVQLTYRSRVPTYNLTQGFGQRLGIFWKYLRYQEGPIANAYEAAAFLRLTVASAIPEVQVFFAPIGWGVAEGAAQLSPYPAMKLVILRSHAASRGRVRLASADPAAAPIIEPRMVEDWADVECLDHGIAAVRAIMAARPISELVTGEVTSTEELRRRVEMSCHVMGTCRMGTGADSVVGPDMRVHGLENLWIADASIVPDAISANLNAPSMMIGTKLGQQLAASR